MTPTEQDLLEVIGNHVMGPRHMTSVDASPENIAALEGLIEQDLVESTCYVQRDPYPMVRVCLTGKGWVRYKELPG